MALITCPDCGKQVSDKATHCPQCGCPITTCPECKAQVPDKAPHCPQCGHPIAKPDGGSRLSAFARVVAIYCVYISPVMFGIDLVYHVSEWAAEQSKKSQPNYQPKYTVAPGAFDPQPLDTLLDWALRLKSLVATALLLWGGIYLLRIDRLGADDRKRMADTLRLGFLVAIVGSIAWAVLVFSLAFAAGLGGTKIRDDPVEFSFLVFLGLIEIIFVVAAAIWCWLPKTYRQLQS